MTGVSQDYSVRTVGNPDCVSVRVGVVDGNSWVRVGCAANERRIL